VTAPTDCATCGHMPHDGNRCHFGTSHSSVSPPCPCGAPVAYARGMLVTVLVYHQRANIGACGCGWSVPGASHAEHIADVYEQAVRTGTRPQCPVCRHAPHGNYCGEPFGYGQACSCRRRWGVS
jgi:hypothetical protein